MSAINFLAMMMSTNLSSQAMSVPQAEYVEAVAVSTEYQDAQDFYFCPKDGRDNPIVQKKSTTYNPHCWRQISLAYDESEVTVDLVAWQKFGPNRVWPKLSMDESITRCQNLAKSYKRQDWRNATYRFGSLSCGVDIPG
jgi:hypothetical protein